MLGSMIIHETEAQKKGFRFILGVDEAGRGPLAGPVVAAAVCLKENSFSCRIDDSKKLTAAQRQKAFHEICDKAFVGIGMVSEVGIDQINILNASFRAMETAVLKTITQINRHHKTEVQEIQILVDGNSFKTQLPYSYKTIVGGDASSLSIACASIIAKTYRDRMMERYDQILPQYGFKTHKGYPTASHKLAIIQHGPSIIHRRSFAGVL